MDINHRNVPTAGLVDAIRRFREDTAPLSATIRAVYQRRDIESEWQLVIARLTQTDDVSNQNEEIYRDSAFLELPMKGITLEGFLEEIVGAGHILHGDFPPL